MRPRKPAEAKNGLALEALRAEIDECDRKIIRLLARRLDAVQKIGQYKKIHKLPVFDEAREAKLLADRKRQAAANANYSIEKIFKLND
jgi:chorismate mutase